MTTSSALAPTPSSLVGTQWPGVGNGVYVRKGDRVLFGRRGQKSNLSPDVWCAPGGKIDFGESFEESAKRETREEAGIYITNVKVLGITNDFYPDEGRHFITIALGSDYVSGEPRVMEPGKMEAWEWLTWAEVLERPVLLSTQHFIDQGLSPFSKEVS